MKYPANSQTDKGKHHLFGALKTNGMSLLETERHKHCALAVVRRSQKFSPRRRPLPGGAGRPKFNQLEMVTTFTYKPSLVRIDAAISSYRGNKPTNTQTNTQTHKPDHRQDWLQYTAPQLASEQCNEIFLIAENYLFCFILK